MKHISVAKDYTMAPAGRHKEQGSGSAEEFFDKHLCPALALGDTVLNLDGVIGYANSFINELGVLSGYTFGRAYVERFLTIVSDEETHWPKRFEGGLRLGSENFDGAIVVLEDDQQRIEHFLRKHKSAIVFTTAAHCIEFLKRHDHIKALFLDHDLGGHWYQSENDEDCGTRVAEFLVKSAKQSHVKSIIIHTMNPNAMKNMYHAIRKAGYRNVQPIPFTRLLKDYLKRFI